MQAYFSRLGLIATGMAVAVGCGGNSESGSRADNDAGVTDASLSDASGTAGDVDSGGPPNPQPAPPPPFKTGLDGGTELGGLSSDDFAKVCADLNAYFQMQFSPKALKPLLCNLTGVLAVAQGTDIGGGAGNFPTNSELRSTCMMARAECLRGPADAAANQLGIDQFNVQCKQPDKTCDVTVKELETCTNDLAALKARLNRSVPTCEELSITTLLGAAIGFQEPMTPNSCERLNRCAMQSTPNPGTQDASANAN